jgi:3-hydroxyacyl-CoA dehydrogenase
VEAGVGILKIDSPPVNALGIGVRRALADGIARFSDDAAVKAIVLICEGRTFFAGADISEFGKPPEQPDLSTLFNQVERVGKPVIAAIHGSGLGGGLELALVCTHRIAVPSAKLGLPEVNLGILPGLGGTQRLTRIVGPAIALDLITSGRAIGAAEALSLGVIDRLASEGQLEGEAIAFAQQLIEEAVPMTLVRDREDKVAPWRGKPELFEIFRKKQARAFRGLLAPEAIIKAIEAAVERPFDEGMAVERALFQQLVASTQSAARRHVFFAERQTSKIPDLPANTIERPIRSVGVVGAGTMGGGITMNFLNIGVPVTLVERAPEALGRGIGVIRHNYEVSAKRGKLTLADVESRMALITPTTDVAALAQVDLIIEAVFESMPLKKELFAQLDKIAKPDAILATNTSFLDVNEIAAATARPEQVVGLHFFSPANVMRLLEVVRGAKASASVIATAMGLARKINKVPVLSGICHGFIANRLMGPRSRLAETLVLAGTPPEQVDRALFDYGFAMGPFAMTDLVGLDVLGRDATERTLRGDFVARGRLGQKQNGGYYDYDESRKATTSPVAMDIIREFAAFRGIEQQPPLDDQAIIARLLYPVVNEGAKILEEGIALRASDIDVAAILGYNWPAHTGGPMFWGERVGLPEILARLKEFETAHGEAYRPARLLEQLVEKGSGFDSVVRPVGRAA